MRVFVAGATGVLGTRLVESCADRGHEVVGLSRSPAGDDRVSERGGEPYRGDLLEPGSLDDGVAGADVVVHAATKIPTDTNPSDEVWALNDRVRREGTKRLLAAAADAGADRFVMQSIAWLARQPDGSEFDETAEPNPDPSTQSALDAERLVADAGEEHGFQTVVLRGGWFYAADTAHTRTFGEQLSARRLPVVGRGPLGRRDAALSFIHVDDVGRAFADAVEGDSTGTFHVVDDQPVTYAEFLRTFADRLGAPPPRRVPAWLARWLVDDNFIRLNTRPMPTSNERFREAFGWSPAYPTIETGLDQVVAQWRERGVIRQRNGRWEWAGA